MGGVEVTIKVLNAQITTVDACGLGLGALGALTIRNRKNL